MNGQPLSDMTLKEAINAVERQRMQLIETLARLIDDSKAGQVVDMEEAASIIDSMATFCEPDGVLELHKLSLLVRRILPSQLQSVAPRAVSILFNYDKFPFGVVDVFPEVITN